MDQLVSALQVVGRLQVSPKARLMSTQHNASGKHLVAGIHKKILWEIGTGHKKAAIGPGQHSRKDHTNA